MQGIKGICLENGMHVIGDIKRKNDDILIVEGLLQLTIGQNPEGQHYTTFQHLNPFVNEKELTDETHINRNKIVFIFEVDAEIKKAYSSSVSKLIVPEQQGIIVAR